MFGTIPKVLWERTNPADDRNRILMGLNCLLIRTPTENILVDTGLGTGYDEKFAFLYGVDKSQTDLLRSIAAAGVAGSGYQQGHFNTPAFRSRRRELFSRRKRRIQTHIPKRRLLYQSGRTDVCKGTRPAQQTQLSPIHVGVARKTRTDCAYFWG